MSRPAPRPIRHLHEMRSVVHGGTFVQLPCLEIEVDGKLIRYAESDRLVYERVATIFSKEPTTIPWLEAIRADETLVDIGANIGLYSIYAAAYTGCRVFAFEPEALNYAELNKNVFVNDLHGRVSAFCIAMSDEQKVDYLHLGAFGVGYSHHDFGENTWTADMEFGAGTTSKDARLPQGAVCSTLDALVEQGVVPVPDHIKIDVDGLEHRVIAGCRRTLHDERVKSVLLEVDHRIERCRELIEEMTAMGWRHSMAQLRTNRKRILPVEEIARLQRDRRGGLNYIFFREAAYEELFASFLATYEPPLDEKGRAVGGPPKVTAAANGNGAAATAGSGAMAAAAAPGAPRPGAWGPPTLRRALRDVGYALWLCGQRWKRRRPRVG